MNLDDITGPEDIQELDNTELERLAGGIRERIIATVAKNGGHLASNLGVVELTLALHLIFKSPRDKIIWDVGHQCYTHKLITGRVKEFSTLRSYNGLSGFPKSGESMHDIVETGHSSTSLSQAVGLAAARDQKGESFEVVAVIGDGALTGGMALEALNHIGHLKKKIIVILNDNEMSIAPNVGAIASYLARVRSDPFYHKIKEDLELILKRIPTIGGRMVSAMERVKGGLKYLLIPGVFFEQMGLKYLGPVDGHNLNNLRENLKRARSIDEPVLIHVVTEKGKGYTPAEENPAAFHGTGPFEVETGVSFKKKSNPSFTEIFSKAVCEEADKNEKIVAITAAMPEGTGLDAFARKYPDRFFDVGIAEQHAVTLAAGMARGGLIPIVALYSTFLQRAYDQVVHDICMPNLPVVLAVDRGGLVGEDGETHHGVFDLSFLRHIPNMVVATPRDENELQRLIRFAIKYQGPVAIRYPRGRGTGVPLGPAPPLHAGEGQVLKEGKDIVIAAWGNMVLPSLEAATMLEATGTEVGVIDMRFIKPLAENIIVDLAHKAELIVTVEENAKAGGAGSAVLELFAARRIDVPVMNIGLPDKFITHGNADLLRAEYALTGEGIFKSIKEYLRRSTGRRWSALEKKAGHSTGGKRAFFVKK